MPANQAGIVASGMVVPLPSGDGDASRFAFGATDHDVDVAAQARQHAEQTLGREPAQFSRDDQGNLRRRVAHDVGGFGLCELLVLENVRDFFGEHILGDHGFRDRPGAALRRSSHGGLGQS